MRRPVAVLLAFALASCGARPSSRTAGEHGPPPPDDAVALAALLPETAERCVVSRPSRLSAQQRPLALYLAWSEPAAFESALGIVAYASARATLDVTGGPRFARRSLFRFGPGERSFEERARDLPVRWLDEPCEGLSCRLPVARWVDERTVEVSLHAWPSSARGVETHRCVSSARAMARRQDFEIAWMDRPVRPDRRLVRQLPELAERRLEARHGVQTHTRYMLEDEFEAEAFVRTAHEVHDRTATSLMDLGPAERSVARDDRYVTVTERRSWGELDLALGDERIRREAARFLREREVPRPVVEINGAAMRVVLRQVQLRRRLLRRLRGVARGDAAAEIVLLLAHAVTRNPTHSELWVAWFEVEMGERAQPAEALAVARRALALAHTPEDRLAWQGRIRHALARHDEAAHADALVEAGLASRADAARTSAEIRALVTSGVEHEWAEGAVRVGAELFGGAAPSHPVHATLPLRGALAALVGLLRVEGAPPASAVHVGVRAAFAGDVRAVGVLGPDLLVFPRRSARGQAEGLAILATPSASLLAVRTLTDELRRELLGGPVEIAIRMTGPEGVFSLRVRGSVDDDSLTLRAVDAERSAARWGDLERYLGAPLAELPTRLFPPPEVRVRASSDEDAAELVALAPEECTSAGPVVRCTAPGRPRSLERSLLRLAAARLSR